jgi:hypothetical protein
MGEQNLLSPDNNVLLLIDRKPSQFAAVQSFYFFQRRV